MYKIIFVFVFDTGFDLYFAYMLIMFIIHLDFQTACFKSDLKDNWKIELDMDRIYPEEVPAAEISLTAHCQNDHSITGYVVCSSNASWVPDVQLSACS